MHDDITDIPGIRVGHDTDAIAQTGCTVILCEPYAVGGVDVRGGAPGTRETDLLDPTCTVHEVHAVVLSGGSAFGLDVAGGVMQMLEEAGIGFDAGPVRVPIVPAAVLFDLNIGDPTVRPDAASGRRAVAAATHGPIAQGSVGAGTGATVNKMYGPDRIRKGGLGSASTELPDGTIVGAIVAVNALGNVEDGKIDSGLATNAMAPEPAFGNTTIAVVATTARLDKAQATKMAQMAHDGLARVINPVHTPFDGDVVFALSIPVVDSDSDDFSIPVPISTLELMEIGAVAADTLARAVLKGVAAA